MARAIVIKEGKVLLKTRKVGEIIENVTLLDIRNHSKYIKLYDGKEKVAATNATEPTTTNDTADVSKSAKKKPDVVV